MGRVLAHLDPDVEIVVTSPLVRAVETGELIGKELSHHPIMHVSGHLAPGFSNGALYRELMALGAGASIVAVGHQPDMAAFVSYMISGEENTGLAMSPGSVAKLVLESGQARAYLRWLLPPDVVRMVSTEL
jgi:phosphohistidine phosphatase